MRFFISTEELLGEGLGKGGLNSDKEAPWADLPNKLTAHRLGKELRAYEVESHIGRVDETSRKQTRGYWSNDIERVALQYRKRSVQGKTQKVSVKA